LQKKTEVEELIPIEEENYDVFMAIVDKVGKDRRGVPIYVKDEDGAEILYTQIKKWLALTENGHEVVRSRQERVKHLDDDLPKIAAAYKEFKEAHK
jgi:type I restriction enzyme M protein